MTTKKWLGVIGGIIVLIAAILVAFLAGTIKEKSWINSVTAVQVAPMQLAEAMSSDDFWGTYNGNRLVMTAPIAAIQNGNNDTVLKFAATSSPSVLSDVLCNLGSASTSVKVGDTVTVTALGEGADREPSSGVLLNDCVLMAN